MDTFGHQLNFAVGPVMISKEILEIGSYQVPYFRTEEFSSLMLENEKMMKNLLDAEQSSRVIFLTGSGTAAMEASVINTFDERDSLLIVNGGSFGQRFCEICKVYKIPFTEIKLTPGESLTSDMLEAYSNKSYSGFLVNMHETSTGVLYDMELISSFCQNNNLFLIIDAISSFITDPISMRSLKADIILTGSQKALAVPPGVSIVAMNMRAIKRIESKETRCLYLDLKSALKNGERGQTPFTPAIGVLFQLHSRMKQILATGLEEERAKINSIAEDFRRRIKDFPFTIPSESLSNAMTPLSPSNGKSAFKIYEILKTNYNIVVCPNGGDLAESLFRVGHMGDLSVEDNSRLFEALSDMQLKGLL